MTSTLSPTQNPKIVQYLARLDAAVGRLPHAEACDLVREIQVHIADKIGDRFDDDAVDRALAALGSPEELAQNYRLELMFTRASRTFSPWLLLRTTGRWAKVGAKGFGAFLLGLAGYTCGLALTVTVLLKPFVSGIGLWVGPRTFDFGMPSDPSAHEVLGSYYPIVTTALAFVIVVGTTQALRWMIRKRTPNVAIR